MKKHARQTKPISLIPLMILLIFIAVIIGAIYILFEKPSTIICGILLEQKDNKGSIEMKLGWGTKTRWIKVNKSLGIVKGVAYDVKLKGIVVKEIRALKVHTGKLYARSSERVILGDNTLALSPEAAVYHLKSNSLEILSANNVVVGTDNSQFIEDNGKITAILVQPITMSTLRVGISDNDFKSYKHKLLIMHTVRGFMINDHTPDAVKVKCEYIEARYDQGQIKIYSLSKHGTSYSVLGLEFTTKKRLVLSPLRAKPIYVDSLKRTGYNYTPKYYGTFELTPASDAISLINEVDVESYLRFVVPSEMLPAAGLEGYKVQAVAARTYALSELLGGRFAKYGFHLDDTTSCQMYNSQPANDSCDEAVAETSGQVLTYEGKTIDAKYYSTSCGVGAPYNEIWYNGKLPGKENPEPYLTYRNYSSPAIADLSDNYTAANYFKDWTINSYDSNSPYFRWKYTLDSKTMASILNKRITELYQKNKNNFSKKVIFNFYQSAKIPKNGIGDIKDVYVSKRGSAGNVLEITIVSSTGTYHVDKEYNIKRLLVDDSISITPLYGTELKNPSPLPSTFYVIDKDTSGSKIKGITIYGGGFGHGAGMSQYGVIGLVRRGKSYTDILNVYYSHVAISNYTKTLSRTME